MKNCNFKLKLQILPHLVINLVLIYLYITGAKALKRPLSVNVSSSAFRMISQYDVRLGTHIYQYNVSFYCPQLSNRLIIVKMKFV
jgi:hypothetical protein